MDSQELKQELRAAAIAYAVQRSLPVDDSHASAVIFLDLADNFNPASFDNITRNESWAARTRKAHPNVPHTREMQSSNSSDALLMSIFCHPSFHRWEGVGKILGARVESVVFGFPGEVRLNGGKVDATEIDMALPGVFCEAKLTESDFTRQARAVVDTYADLENVFHVDALPKAGDSFDNYQVIRNLLASVQHDRNHILFCDERRPDLSRRYFNTVACLREVAARKRCRVVFWQEIAAACGREFREWIETKYGIR